MIHGKLLREIREELRKNVEEELRHQKWKNVDPLSERLTSLCIMWGPLKPFEHHSTMVLRASRRVLNLFTIMPQNASFSDSQCNLFRCGCDQVTDHRIHCHALMQLWIKDQISF